MASSLDTVPAALISEILHSLELKAVQFHCRVVAVYILVLEKNNKVVYSHPNIQSRSPVINISLAGFVLDDGSSLCCCWADKDRAATLLRLHDENSVGDIDKIFKQHGQIVVRNYGSLFDSLCQDLTFSGGSENVISSSDEDLLKFIILDACFGSFWTVVGSLMDLHAVGQLERRLVELEMTMHPLQNIWATEVYHTNPLSEARKSIQGLLNR